MPAKRNDWAQRYWRDRYQSERWRRRRRLHLRSNPLCATCLANGLAVPATIVDHIQDHGEDSTWTSFLLADVQSLCRPCHEAKHGRGLDPHRPWIGTDGWPTEDSKQNASPSSRDGQPFDLNLGWLFWRAQPGHGAYALANRIQKQSNNA
jgi:5-methylcytosine-specific restriction endonuclease McrA